MGQSSYVYILWLVMLAAGLWIIIGFGSLLHAREDLAGDWELTPEAAAQSVESRPMKVEQSGRYFNIILPGGESLRMKMIDEAVVDQRFGEHKRITLSGEGVQATFEGRSRGDLWRFSLDGKVQGAFVAHLVGRVYPKPVPATRPVSARAAHAR